VRADAALAQMAGTFLGHIFLAVGLVWLYALAIFAIRYFQ
jgi:hypothetical protein